MGDIKTATGIIEEVIESVCNDLCKYPDKYAPEEWEKVLEQVCQDCPLNKL